VARASTLNKSKYKSKGKKLMKKAIFHMITGLLAIGLVFGVNRAQAQAGSLDTTFGKGGIVTANLGVTAGSLIPIEQSNGDIAVVTAINRSGFPNLEVFGLLRYTSSGTLLGTTTASFFTNGISRPVAVAVQSNGDIVVAGTASSGINQPTEFALARFLPSGKLDTTFGSGGLVTTIPSGIFPSVSAVIVQPNGQIVVGGFVAGVNRHTGGQTVLVRYSSNGSLDTAFGEGGIVEAPTAAASPTVLAELSDGSYLAVGGTSSVEFSSTGVLQSTVTPGSLVAASQSAAGCCSPAFFQPNGDYVVAETVGAGFQRTDGEAFRFSETGVEGSSFSSPKFTFGGQARNTPQAIAPQSNGQIVVGGLFGLARLDSNGALDGTFGSSGSLATIFGVTGLLIQTDGKIVAAGDRTNTQTGITTLTVARYLAN
jgi:uncharacterized delta-60 repeat protein